jgi:hypothetical protein
MCPLCSKSGDDRKKRFEIGPYDLAAHQVQGEVATLAAVPGRQTREATRTQMNY